LGVRHRIPRAVRRSKETATSNRKGRSLLDASRGHSTRHSVRKSLKGALIVGLCNIWGTQERRFCTRASAMHAAALKRELVAVVLQVSSSGASFGRKTGGLGSAARRRGGRRSRWGWLAREGASARICRRRVQPLSTTPTDLAWELCCIALQQPPSLCTCTYWGFPLPQQSGDHLPRPTKKQRILQTRAAPSSR
jgi:hypothetical protein